MERAEVRPSSQHGLPSIVVVGMYSKVLDHFHMKEKGEILPVSTLYLVFVLYASRSVTLFLCDEYWKRVLFQLVSRFERVSNGISLNDIVYKAPSPYHMIGTFADLRFDQGCVLSIICPY